jgi:hypothetical protein
VLPERAVAWLGDFGLPLLPKLLGWRPRNELAHRLAVSKNTSQGLEAQIPKSNHLGIQHPAQPTPPFVVFNVANQEHLAVGTSRLTPTQVSRKQAGIKLRPLFNVYD